MINEQPFHIDPSATSSFTALRDSSTPDSLRSADGSAFKAVVVGGGTGASMSIRALLQLGAQTSAVISMADDGGSTGILRAEAESTPPGDIRKCLAAFARDPSDPFVKAFKTRIAAARDHALGNLLLAALEDACGSFPEAIAICEDLLDARGHVYPSTLARVTLQAKTRDGMMLDSQVAACHSDSTLERVYLRGADNRPLEAYAPALAALREADLIVLGPGSLYTSIIPNLLVPGILDAICASRGQVLFVCSLADVQGETRGMSVRDHVEALFDYGMRGIIDYVLVHTKVPLTEHNVRNQVASQVPPVAINYADMMAIQAEGPRVVARDMVDPDNPLWHEPAALCEAFSQIIDFSRRRKG